MPDWNKFIASKIALAKKGSQPSKSGANARVPAGQTEVKNFPRLDLGIVPDLNLQNWRLRVFGLVENELNLDWAAFQSMHQVTEVSDFHCVTRWSRFDNRWEGVPFRAVCDLTRPKAEATHVLVHAAEGYATNVPLKDLLEENVLFAFQHDGTPLTPEHGGPLRLVVSKLYAWKSAKWVRGLEFLPQDRLGFWEQNGYHAYGDPFKEQRHTDDE